MAYLPKKSWSKYLHSKKILVHFLHCMSFLNASISSLFSKRLKIQRFIFDASKGEERSFFWHLYTCVSPNTGTGIYYFLDNVQFSLFWHFCIKVPVCYSFFFLSLLG